MTSKPVDTIEQVLERMHGLEEALPDPDGVMWFNRLYLSVTESVKKSVDDGGFAASEFLARLDVVFARLYFEAVDTSLKPGGKIPKAWAPLFEARARRDVAPIQFAVCGMNAHINNDLPIALVRTARDLGIELELKSPEHDSYMAVNKTLKKTEAEVKRWFATGFVGVIDRTFGDVDDVVAIWNVARARDHAWTVAETLEVVQRVPFVRDRFLHELAGMVGFAGRGLLTPTG